jgi:hypothetical protein
MVFFFHQTAPSKPTLHASKGATTSHFLPTSYYIWIPIFFVYATLLVLLRCVPNMDLGEWVSVRHAEVGLVITLVAPTVLGVIQGMYISEQLN